MHFIKKAWKWILAAGLLILFYILYARNKSANERVLHQKKKKLDDTLKRIKKKKLERKDKENALREYNKEKLALKENIEKCEKELETIKEKTVKIKDNPEAVEKRWKDLGFETGRTKRRLDRHH